MLDLLSCADASGKFFPTWTIFAGKMQFLLQTPPSGGLFAFSGDGLVPSKPQLPCWWENATLCLSDGYEERFTIRLKNI